MVTRQSRRRFAFQLAGAVAAVSLAATLGIQPAQAEGDPIRIGMTSALTGPYNEYGEGNHRGVQLAVEKWNANGGINGRPIELAVVLDDQLVPDRAVQNMRRLLDDDSLVAFIGPAGSGPVLAVIEMAAADGRPYMNSVAQTPAITYPDGGPPRRNVFTFALQNDVEARMLGQYVAERFERIGLLHESTAYGVTGIELVANELAAAGIEPVGTESYNQRVQDVTAQLARLQRADAEAVLSIGLGADMAVIRRTMARLNFEVPLIGSAGTLSLPYEEGAGELVVGTQASMIAAFGREEMTPEAQAFADAYKERFGVDRWWGNNEERPQIVMALTVSNAYDAADLLFEGIRRAESTEPDAIIDALESITGYQGVNAVYNFSPERHHAIEVDDLAMFEYILVEGEPALRMIAD